MATSPDVVYKPVAVDPQEQFEMDRQNEHNYRRNLRKTVNIVIFIITCLVVASLISVIIIILSPRHPGTTYTFKTIPTNFTGELTLTRYPDNSSIESDFEKAIDRLYNESVFSEVYVKAVVLNLQRGPNSTEMKILLVFRDIGDDLGASSGSSDEATDVFDFLLIALKKEDFYGFHVKKWIFHEDNIKSNLTQTINPPGQ